MADAPPGGENVPKPDEDLDDLDDLDLDFDSDLRKLTIWMKLTYVIMLAGVAVMIGYLVLIVVFPEKFSPQDWIGDKSQKKKAVSIGVDLTLVKGFKIGGLYMGDSPEAARRTFPSLTLIANPNFGPSDQIAQIGQYRHHDGDYQAFFRGPKQGNRLFKVKSRHTYSEISYLELLSELSGRYGKPQKSDCGAQEKEFGIRCELYWRMSETLIEARILTTAPKGGGPSVTELFVQARDIRTNSYFSRLKIQQQALDKETTRRNKKLKDVQSGK